MQGLPEDEAQDCCGIQVWGDYRYLARSAYRCFALAVYTFPAREGYKCFLVEALWELLLDDKAKLLEAKLLVELVWPFWWLGELVLIALMQLGELFGWMG